MTAQAHTYSFQIAQVKPWYNALFSSVKKDLRNEHLRHDKAFFRNHFGTKNMQKLSVDDLIAVYPKVIATGHEALAEFIINRWLLRHVNIYNFFELKLQLLHKEVHKITHIEDLFANQLLENAQELFGAQDTYLFCIFNSVQISSHILEQLRNMALHETRATDSAATT